MVLTELVNNSENPEETNRAVQDYIKENNLVSKLKILVNKSYQKQKEENNAKKI